MNYYLFLSGLWLLIPLIAWLESKYLYDKNLGKKLDQNPYRWYLTICISEALMLTLGFIIGVI